MTGPYELLLGDLFEQLPALEAESVHSVVTDPPYGIRIMGEAWDGEEIEAAAAAGHASKLAAEARGGKGRGGRQTSAFTNRATEGGAYDFSPKGMVAFHDWSRMWATEAFRVLKPGGYLLSFSSDRTYHRMTCGIEEAGFQIRHAIFWCFAQGFPKALDVAKAIDHHLGADRVKTGEHGGTLGVGGNAERAGSGDRYDEPATPEAAAWEGWATALKPALEPVVVARKPFSGTVAANVLENGTGAFNIAGCRIGDTGGVRTVERAPAAPGQHATSFAPRPSAVEEIGGRWPSNVIMSHHPECQGAGARHSLLLCHPDCPIYMLNQQWDGVPPFFYVPKPDSKERHAGSFGNLHPTVKPVDLMRWLVRLVTPPDGTVLDPFLGSGSTGCAAMAEGFQFVGIEREEKYMEIARPRIADYAFAHGRTTREAPEGAPQA